MTPLPVPTLPPGLIGVPCGELARYSDFLPSIVRLWKPPGTKFKKQQGLGTAQPLNNIAQAFIDDPTLQWLFLTNDDNIVPADTIYRLWAHHVDVCTGLYFGRVMPFEPIIFDKVEQLTYNGAKRNWYTRHLMKPGESGLIPIVACGDGCMLIRRHVIEELTYPWWEYGETFGDACDHDMVFSRKVREAGFKLWCDLDVKVDHLATVAVRPHREPDGVWQTLLVQGDGGDKMISLPAAGVGPTK